MKILALETSTAVGGVSFLENDQLLFSEYSNKQKNHSELVHQFILNGLKELNWKMDQIDFFASTQGPGSFTGIRVSGNTLKSYAYSLKKPLVAVSSLDVLAEQVFLQLDMNQKTQKNGEDIFKKPIFCMINAYKNMVYFAKYIVEKKFNEFSSEEKKIKKIISSHDKFTLKREIDPAVIPVKNLDQIISEETYVAGDGFITYEKYFSEALKNKIVRVSSENKNFFENSKLENFKKYSREPYAYTDYPSSMVLGQIAYQHYISENNPSTFEWNLYLPLYLRASEAEENKKGILYIPLK